MWNKCANSRAKKQSKSFFFFSLLKWHFCRMHFLSYFWYFNMYQMPYRCSWNFQLQISSEKCIITLFTSVFIDLHTYHIHPVLNNWSFQKKNFLSKENNLFSVIYLSIPRNIPVYMSFYFYLDFFPWKYLIM